MGEATKVATKRAIRCTNCARVIRQAYTDLSTPQMDYFCSVACWKKGRGE